MNAEASNPKPTMTRRPPWKDDVPGKPIPIRTAVQNFLNAKKICCKNPKTLCNYQSALNLLILYMVANELYYLQDLRPEVLTDFFYCLKTPYLPSEEPYSENCREWMDEKDRGKKYTEDTLSNQARPVKTMLRYYMKNAVLPFFIYEQPKANTTGYLPSPTEVEFDRIMAQCNYEYESLPILFMADTGTRIEETTKLNWGDLNVEKQEVRVIDGKWGKHRQLSVSKPIVDRLMAYKKGLPPTHTGLNDPIFHCSLGKRWTISGLQSMLARIKKKSGVDFSAHDLRRFAFRAWTVAGRTLDDSRLAGGHSYDKTTRKYIGRVVTQGTPGQHATNALEFLLDEDKIQPLRSVSYNPKDLQGRRRFRRKMFVEPMPGKLNDHQLQQKPL